AAPHLVRHGGLLHHRTQGWYRPPGSLLRGDHDSRAAQMTALLAAHLDCHLITKAQRSDRGIEHIAVGAAIHEGTQHHVTGDAGEAVEVGDLHRRALRISTAAASIGRMPGGRFATRTVTAATPRTSRVRRAIRSASTSMRCAGSPATTSLAIERTTR